MVWGGRPRLVAVGRDYINGSCHNNPCPRASGSLTVPSGGKEFVNRAYHSLSRA